MKRPVIAYVLIWGVGMLLWLKSLILAALVIVIFLIYYRNNIKEILRKHGLILLAICLFGLIRFLYYDHTFDHEVAYLQAQETLTIEGVVCREEARDDYNIYYIDKWFTQGEGKDYNGHYMLKIYSDENYDIGDVIVIKGQFVPNKPKANEGGFDGESYGRQIKNVGVMSGTDQYLYTSNDHRVKAFLRNLRESHYRIFCQILPEREAQIIGKLVLGMDTVDEEVEEGFRGVGLIHILAISGLHVSIIGLSLFGLLKKKIKNEVASVITIVLVLAYCYYTGMGASTFRASLMLIIYLIKFLIKRRYDPTTSMMVAAVILLLMNPYYLINNGFLLSFSAVISLFYIVPTLKRDVIKGEGFLWDQLRTMLGVQIGLSPVLIFFYHQLPIYSIFANLLILPIVSGIITLSLIAIIASTISIGLGSFIIGGVYWLLNYTLMVIELIEKLPFNQLSVGEFSIFTLAMIILLFAIWIKGYNKKWLLVGALTLVMFNTISFYNNYNRLTINHMDVGQGDCAIIHYKGQTIMIDGGGVIGKKTEENVGSYVLLPYFESKGIQEIDAVFISHSDFDHIYGIVEIMDSIKIGQLFLSDYDRDRDTPLLEQLRNKIDDTTEIVYLVSGDQVAFGDVIISCYNPDEKRYYDNPNDASLILTLEYKAFDALFLGDASIDQEKMLVETLPTHNDPIELVKVGHHGSDTATSDALYQVLEPCLSVISVGVNHYGHPLPSVMTTLEGRSEMVLLTRDSGQIIIRTNGNDMTVKTMK